MERQETHSGKVRKQTRAEAERARRQQIQAALRVDLFSESEDERSQAQSKGVEPAQGPRAESEREHGTAAGGGPLFQSYGHCCDKDLVHKGSSKEKPICSPEDLGDVVGYEYRVRPCRCRRWFCEYCGPRQGWKVRHRLLWRLREFKSVFGVTLTVDGSLFDSPEHSWLYVMENRLLGRFVRDLERGGFLCSKSYFWVVEFQETTEQPHWHMVLDAERIPYGILVEIWSRFRPSHAPQLSERVTAENYRGKAPAFGSIKFSPPADPITAGYYATKYLTKYPDYGYPAWVLDRVGRMPRYGHSHRFFPTSSGHDPMCFCEVCRGDALPEKRIGIVKKSKADKKNGGGAPRSYTTIRERLEQCGNRCTIVQVGLVRLPDGTIVDGKGKYDGMLEMSFREACEYLGVSADGRWQLELTWADATALEEYARDRPTQREAA